MKGKKTSIFILTIMILLLPLVVFAATDLPETGQTKCYQTSGTVPYTTISCTGSGQDGAYKMGAAWPAPRFTDNTDGTITDNLTGLQWMKNANCMSTYYSSFDTRTGGEDSSSYMTATSGGVRWEDALIFVKGINDATYPNCQFGHTDWRLPNKNELFSLVNFEQKDTTAGYTDNVDYLQDNGFTNILYHTFQGYAPYWTSTTRINPTNGVGGQAYYVDMYAGFTKWDFKTPSAVAAIAIPYTTFYMNAAVLPVRTAPSGPTCTDADLDTYAVEGGACGAVDCDDSNAAVNPGATEICNSIDDDCDTLIDEGVTSAFYHDGDSDTYGDPLDIVGACTPPAGYVTDNTDCDDSNAAVNPGATEICNSIDDDCDTLIDEGGVCGPTCTDADLDTYAVEGGACGAVDCDDSDAAVNPGATEVNNNGKDDDCNASTPTASASGIGYNYPVPLFRASLNVNTTGTGALSYYYTRLRLSLISTSMTGVVASGGTATVTGVGKVNGVSGCTYTATVTDGSPDAMGITIVPGGSCATSYSVAPLSISGGGGYTVVGQ